MNGKFIVIEGLEGAGKTTACKIVEKILREHGIDNIVFTREPGGTPISEKLRDLFKRGVGQERLNIKAELLILYAARVQLVETVIKPALKRGMWVIGDRHDLSSQAYQGAGRKIDPQLILLLRNMILGDFSPDLTLYLDIPHLIGLKRVNARGELDRIEQEVSSFFTRTRACYLEAAALDASIMTIDATEPFEKVTESIYSCVSRWLQQQKDM